MNSSKDRIEALDYLRGLLAVAVMVYHYASWGGVELDADTVLARLGIYAVSSFYILSGLSLALVYGNDLGTRDAVARYGIHRLFRIVPLFWVAVTLSLLLIYVPPAIKDAPAPAIEFWRIFLNYSLLFGFLQPDAYFSAGAWSIGNEVVFYALFPLLVLAKMRKPLFLWLAFFASLLVASMLTVRIAPDQSLADQWKIYIHPLNQLPFFVAGMLVANNAALSWLSGRGAVAVALVGVLLFVFYGAEGEPSNLVTMGSRSIFFVACLLVVVGVYRANDVLTKIPCGETLAVIGASTYSIYLLHPFAPVLTTRLFGDGPLGYVVAGILTMLVSWASYRWFELPLMRKGKRVAKRQIGSSEFVRSDA